MILCDIGNTYFHFYCKGRVWRESPKTLSSKDGEIFYISVNPNYEKLLLEKQRECINLAPFFSLDTAYVGLGIDRVAVCEGVDEGVIVDAGSAITVDVMQKNMHLGGYILPGIGSFVEMYKQISPALDILPDFSIEFDLFPQNTKEALGYAILRSIVGLITEVAKEKKIYFCGGDGKFFSKFFKNCIYDETLVFKGMQKAWERYNEQNF